MKVLFNLHSTDTERLMGVIFGLKHLELHFIIEKKIQLDLFATAVILPNKKIWKMHYGSEEKYNPLLNQQKTLLL